MKQMKYFQARSRPYFEEKKLRPSLFSKSNRAAALKIYSIACRVLQVANFACQDLQPYLIDYAMLPWGLTT